MSLFKNSPTLTAIHRTPLPVLSKSINPKRPLILASLVQSGRLRSLPADVPHCRSEHVDEYVMPTDLTLEPRPRHCLIFSVWKRQHTAFFECVEVAPWRNSHLIVSGGNQPTASRLETHSTNLLRPAALRWGNMALNRIHAPHSKLWDQPAIRAMRDNRFENHFSEFAPLVPCKPDLRYHKETWWLVSLGQYMHPWLCGRRCSKVHTHLSLAHTSCHRSCFSASTHRCTSRSTPRGRSLMSLEHALRQLSWPAQRRT